MTSPLPDQEKFDSPLENSYPASQIFHSPLPLKIPEFLSHPQSRVGETLWKNIDRGSLIFDIPDLSWQEQSQKKPTSCPNILFCLISTIARKQTNTTNKFYHSVFCMTQKLNKYQ